ncbi:phosphate signaling complex protein PhoU [Xanthomonadaceae bacterium JHOS43]|nr:phosphate signaling complex protein PhoU [Xanthomonadaceae bacterium JHOS43]MCX7563281.1 phosphate signaling complex protein PhoU [Xanthomonadaceae bacterium XH05]
MNHEHIIKSYDEELTRLTGEIVRMGELAAYQLGAAMDVLDRRDTRAAERVIANDDAIDALEGAISHDVLQLLVRRQPMARDLREVLAALRISAAIERIGDYAANVAKRSTALNRHAPVPAAQDIRALATLAIELLQKVLVAYRDRDAEAADMVRRRDAELDTLHTQVFRELLDDMARDPSTIPSCAHLLFIAKNIERIGDHATNIAENVWFLVHGEEPQEARPKSDESSQMA